MLITLLSALGFNAFDYMLLGRMVYFYLPSQSIFGIRATSLTKIFVVFDITAFIVQAVGGTMASTGPGESQSAIDLGLHIYMGGIGFQQLAILVFSAMAVQLHVHLARLEKDGTLAEVGKERGWRRLLYALYASLICITVRSPPVLACLLLTAEPPQIRIVFRLIEYSPAGNSSIPNHEAYFYCLDALPMAIVVYLVNVIHPGTILVGPEAEFPRKSRRQKKEEKKAKKEAKNEEKEKKRAQKEAKKAEKEEKKKAGTSRWLPATSEVANIEEA